MSRREFDLNVEKILEDWEPKHAIREIIANALDEQKLTNTRNIVVKKMKNTWIIRDYGRGLRYVHLTQNENPEKLDRNDLIGKFGIGLKDALATLERHNIKTTIKSKYGKIRMKRSQKYGFEDVMTLHAEIDSLEDNDFLGTEFSFEGLLDKDVIEAKKLFLHFRNAKPISYNDFGEIHDKQASKSNIYINGVKVAEEENYMFDYNITNLNSKIKKALNRERTNVGRSAYSDRIKSILLATNDYVVMNQISKDLMRYNHGEHHDELNWIDIQKHAIRIMNTSNDTVFLTQDELETQRDLVDDMRNNEQEILVIPRSLKEKIANERDISGKPIRDFNQYAKEYNESFVYKFIDFKDLSRSEAKIFNKTKSIMKICNLDKFPTSKIRISKNIRNSGPNNTEGLYDSERNEIIIKRTQLGNLETYAGTLVHELIHAIYGCVDVSRDFETQMTHQIGKLVNKILR